VLRQSLSAARMVTDEEPAQQAVMIETLALLERLPEGTTPPEIAFAVHKIVRDQLGQRDPYREAKAESTRFALALYPRLKSLVAQSDDPLDTAVRLSIAGNIVDFGVSDQIPDLWATVERVMDQALAIDDLDGLREALAAADHVLYLADNAGETVFDRVLIEQLGPPVIYAVKGGPVLNDATVEDALAAGLDSCATIVDNGSAAPGTILGLCSNQFRASFDSAPLIVAKGQANFETLSEAGPRVFCLLQAKCPVIATDVGSPVGGSIVRQSSVPVGRSDGPGPQGEAFRCRSGTDGQ